MLFTGIKVNFIVVLDNTQTALNDVCLTFASAHFSCLKSYNSNA